jgi:trehalose-6-phosphate synthase
LRFKKKKILLGIDNMDKTKGSICIVYLVLLFPWIYPMSIMLCNTLTTGILHRLYAMERLLADNPDMISKIVLIQIIKQSYTPSLNGSGRGSLDEELERSFDDVHELVGRINGRFSTATHVPIHLLVKCELSFARTCALYQVADSMVITRWGNLLFHYNIDDNCYIIPYVSIH